MNVFLTGGTGFIGSHVAVALLEEGHRVTILARNVNKVPALAAHERVTMVEGTLSDFDVIKETMPGHDACVLVAVNFSRWRGEQVLEDDTIPNVFIAEVAAEAGVKQLIYTSSIAINDSLMKMDCERLSVDGAVNTAIRPFPASYYGATKAATEMFLIAKSYQSDMKVNIIRPGYTMGNPAIEGGGPQPYAHFPDLINLALKNEPIHFVKNDGNQFMPVKDIAKLYSSILREGLNRKTYFAVSENFTTWADVARETVQLAGSKSEVVEDQEEWLKKPLLFDAADMKNDFGLVADSKEAMTEHLTYMIERCRQRL